VLDKDPQQAKEMVETLIELVNNKIRRIQRAKYEEVVEINERLMREKEKEIDSVRNIIQNLGKNYGIIDVENQAQEVTEGYLRTVDGNASRINTQGVNRLKSNLEEKGGEFLVYRAYIVNLMTRYNEIKAQYEQAYKDVNKQFTFTNTVTAPFVSDKKAYPVRWLIVLYTVVAALILALIVIAIIENKRSMELFKEES
jgi:capsule polysaccharide export protein KpsE/RkpR